MYRFRIVPLVFELLGGTGVPQSGRTHHFIISSFLHFIIFGADLSLAVGAQTQAPRACGVPLPFRIRTADSEPPDGASGGDIRAPSHGFERVGDGRPERALVRRGREEGGGAAARLAQLPRPHHRQ